MVTSQGAVDTELGVLKTGKEADVFLLERAVPGVAEHAVVMAAKRYRAPEHRSFYRTSAYTEDRRVRRSRTPEPCPQDDPWRAVAAGQWASAEWDALTRLWSAGVPVPYPVQIDGTELLMELVCDRDGPAPRLARARPEPVLLASWFDQLRAAMTALAELGLAHGDLSAYNVLAAGERLVLIDLPQVVDLTTNPHGLDLLMRDCHNVCTWFLARGLEVDEDALFADLLASAF